MLTKHVEEKARIIIDESLPGGIRHAQRGREQRVAKNGLEEEDA